MVRTFQPLREHLGIERIKIGIGGSLGGQQLLEWAIEEPTLFENIVPIATNAVHSAWAIAYNTSQRMCIEQDPTWCEKSPTAGINGMKIARSIGLLSYRNYNTYVATQTGVTAESADNSIDKQVYKVETYQRYQGEKLANRFNAFSYYMVTRSTDSHNVGRQRGSCEAALAQIKARTLAIGISSDWLFPPCEQEYIATHIPNAQVAIIDSFYGHDGFLLEFERIETLLKKFIN
jgi:homoserine O-acetyltransferase